MCLTIKSERVVTKKPIILYKVGNASGEGFESLYYKFEYLPKVINPTEDLEVVIRDCKRRVVKGYHAFLTPKGVLFDCAVQAAKERCENPIVAQFVVPVGSVVYYNKNHNEMVSSSLTFVKTIQLIDKENAK